MFIIKKIEQKLLYKSTRNAMGIRLSVKSMCKKYIIDCGVNAKNNDNKNNKKKKIGEGEEEEEEEEEKEEEKLNSQIRVLTNNNEHFHMGEVENLTLVDYPPSGCRKTDSYL